MDRLVRFAARSPLQIASYALNAAMVAGAVLAFLRLEGVASERWEASGGMPSLGLDALRAAAADPATPGRLVDLGIAWGAGVFAVGFLFLALMGARHLVYAAARLVARF